MNKEIFKDYICCRPFLTLDVQDNDRYLCCAAWLKKDLPKDVSPKEAWESEEANLVRESILDGSYKYCDSNVCPFLNTLKIKGHPVKADTTDRMNTQPLFRKDSTLPPNLQKAIDDYKKGESIPETVFFSFDRTCNLKCPSCRIELFTANSKKIKEVEGNIELIKEQYGSTLKRIYITGSGDPFVSVGFRNFLRNFKKSDWPKLENIHLHTNATRWSKKMWDSMKEVQPYIGTCEISIDAGTKDTYENKTRINGNWEELIENLKFIATISTIRSINTSFVVQQKNYKEMKIFYNLIREIFDHKAMIFFSKIQDWGVMQEGEFIKQEVHNPNHPEHSEFLKSVREVLPAKNAWTNLHEFTLKTNKVI